MLSAKKIIRKVQIRSKDLRDSETARRTRWKRAVRSLQSVFSKARLQLIAVLSADMRRLRIKGLFTEQASALGNDIGKK